MAFDPNRFPRRLNLGCGLDKRGDYLNIDQDPGQAPDLVCDVADLRPLPSGYYEYLLANDILEHLSRLRTRNVLREWNRVLVKGGTLALRVPDVIGLLRLLTQPEHREPTQQERLLQCLFGTQAYPGDTHYTGFTEPLLLAMLDETGFRPTQVTHVDGWLLAVTATKYAEHAVDPIFHGAADDFVVAAYQRVLGRAPDAVGRRHYLGLIAAGIPREAVIAALEASDEYRQRVARGGAHGPA